MRILFLLFFSCWFHFISAQDSDSLASARKGTIFGLPIVYVTPETSWAFGAAGIYSFYLDGRTPRPETRPSQLQLAFAYTLKNQLLFYLPYDIFTSGNRYRFNGEVGFYRYTYFYYGIGNDFTEYPGELFGISFTRNRLHALRAFGKNMYLGLRYWMEDFTVTQVEEGGLLDSRSTREALVSGLGPMFQLDTRDNLFFPRAGSLVEAAVIFNAPLIGSDLTYSKFSLNASKYLNPVKNTVLALNTYLEFNSGEEVPFNQLALLGGGRKLRGYYEGRFRDKNLLILQGEWRFPIWKRIKGTIFGGTGAVSDRIRNFSVRQFRIAYGGGLRYLALKSQQIHIRLDFAWGQFNSSGFYLTIGEAF